MAVTIYHNPRCSKSRQTLALLERRGLHPKIVQYLENPPSRKRLRQILKLLGLHARDLMRKGEPAYRESGLDDESLCEAELIAAMVKNPTLMERPIVLANGKAALGRPPEKVLDIL